MLLIGCQSKHIIENSIDEITLNDFENKIQNKDSFIVIIGREDCPNCIALKEMITKKNITKKIYYMPYTQNNKEKFITEVEQYVGAMELIPYYAKVKKGDVVKTGQGYSDDIDFEKFIED